MVNRMKIRLTPYFVGNCPYAPWQIHDNATNQLVLLPRQE
jgi:hypothetical protein